MLACVLNITSWAQQTVSGSAAAPVNVNALVRRAADNELKATDKAHYMYRLKKVNDEGTQLKEMVETQVGTIGRMILLNGKPLTPAQREKEDRRLQRLVDNPDALRSKQKEQKEDDERTRKMMHALPEAFIYEYVDTVRGEDGPMIHLRFRPNPNFDPPSRETQVYQGMEGEMWVNQNAERIERMQAKLFRNVNFGWGILGHLDRGGRFEVEQADIGNGQWETTRMTLDFTGKALFFKSIKIKSTDVTSNYRRVPDHLSLAQGMELLKQQESEIAANETSESKGGSEPR
jgi:hypothetical protein